MSHLYYVHSWYVRILILLCRIPFVSHYILLEKAQVGNDYTNFVWVSFQNICPHSTTTIINAILFLMGLLCICLALIDGSYIAALFTVICWTLMMINGR